MTEYVLCIVRVHSVYTLDDMNAGIFISSLLLIFHLIIFSFSEVFYFFTYVMVTVQRPNVVPDHQLLLGPQREFN